MALSDPPPYLLGLRLQGRLVVVFGGGRVAARRVPALLESGAVVRIVSPSLSPSLQDLAASGRIRWEQRKYVPGDCEGAWLACAFTADAVTNTAINDDSARCHCWCVRSDDAAASAAWTPATGQVGETRVGVLSGDPRRSAGIRDAILGGLRSGTLGARRGRGRHRGVALVGGGPGDPGLITVRGRQLLAEADVVVTDRLAPQSLLAELPPDVEVIDAAKIPRGTAMAQDQINAILISHAQDGRFVVRLKGGDPFVFGRGAEEVLACLQAGVPVTVVPGVTSAVAVPAAAGIPVTHRGVAQEFHVVSAHAAPDDERSTVNWPALAATTGTLVLLMPLERLGDIAAALIKHGRPPATAVAVIADGTLPTQRTINATLQTVASQAASAGIRPPAVVVVGDVVTLAAQAAELSRAAATFRGPAH
jgi:uroporphyrin-III C-methyltransferase / precorrin-2 dehydrogenase / sirohydrochlorin ferrochelatase